jgi:hypothetical protein
MLVWTFFKVENDRSTSELVAGIVNKKAYNFVTYGNIVLKTCGNKLSE